MANARSRPSARRGCRPAFVFGLNVWYLQKELNLVVDAYQDAEPGRQVTLAA